MLQYHGFLKVKSNPLKNKGCCRSLKQCRKLEVNDGLVNVEGYTH